MLSPIKHKVTLSFCEFTVYENFIYTIMDEGITVTSGYIDILKTLAGTYFANKNFVHISHRINSYSVDPIIYLETSKIPNLKGLVVVNANNNSSNTSDIEKLFFDKPYMVVDTLKDTFASKNTLLSGATHNGLI